MAQQACDPLVGHDSLARKASALRQWLAVMVGALALVPGQAVDAQSLTGIRVGTVQSVQTCQYFQESEGAVLAAQDSAAVIGRGGAAFASSSLYAASWRSWIVRDCQDNFPHLRSTIEAALASSIVLRIDPQGSRIDVTISDVSENGPAAARPVEGRNAYDIAWSDAVVTVAYTVYDRSGRSVDGGAFTKRINLSTDARTARNYTTTVEPGEATYDLIQHEVAMTIARAVAFKIAPLRVTAVDDTVIEINAGQPLIQLGDLLDVDRSQGIGTARYVVSSSSNGHAIAEISGSDPIDIEPGNAVTFVEADSDAANARRTRRSRLP